MLAQEAIERHRHAFPDRPQEHVTLDVGGDYQWRKEGEAHLFSPEVIHGLQKAVRTGDYEAYKQYARVVNEQEKQLFRLRDLLQFKQREPIPLEEVEPIEAITRRFKTGGHELRIHLQGSPRSPGHRHEPHRRQVQHG